MLCDPGPTSWCWILVDVNIKIIIFLDACVDYIHKQRVNTTKQLESILASQQCPMLFLEHSQILSRNGIHTILLMVVTCKCACDDEHMMVSRISLDAIIWYWLNCLIYNILYPSFLSLFILQMLIMMVFLASFLPPMWSFFLPPLGFLLSVLLIHLGLHYILK